MKYLLEDKAIAIRDFAIALGLDITVNTRNPKLHDPGSVYYASLRDVEIREGCCVRSVFGNGHDMEEAVDNMAERYSEQLLEIRRDGVKFHVRAPKLKAR